MKDRNLKNNIVHPGGHFPLSGDMSTFESKKQESEHSNSSKSCHNLEGGSEGGGDKNAEMEVGLKKNLKKNGDAAADGKATVQSEQGVEESKLNSLSANAGGKKTTLKQIDEQPNELNSNGQSHVSSSKNARNEGPSEALKDEASKKNSKKEPKNENQNSAFGIVDMVKNDEEDEIKEDGEEYDQDKDPSQFYMHGKYHTFSKNSLWLFRADSSFRRCVVWIITHKRFDQFIVLLIMFNSLLLGIRNYTPEGKSSLINKFVDEGTEPIFIVAFTLECLLKIVGMGFILDEGSYLWDAWNWLDFIVVISSLLTEIPQMKSVSGMRTFRLMRPLRSLTTMPSMKILISTLLASVAQLGGVLVLAIFFFTIFAILGVSLWVGKIHYRCRLTEFPVDGDWIADPNDNLLCSEHRTCPEQRWCGSLLEASRQSDPQWYLKPDLDLWRDTMIEDLNFGYSSFNHLPSAFLTIFQCITLEGWINVSNMYEDAYSVWFVDIYFLLCIIVCSFFVLNLTIAVMLLKYEEFDKSEKGSTHLQDLHEYGEKIGLPYRFIEFIIEQDNLQVSPKGLKILKNQKQESLFKQLIRSTVTYGADDRYYNFWLTRTCFHIVNSPIFNGVIILIIMLNTVVLSMDKYPEFDGAITDIFSVANLFFTIIFTVEVVLKLIGLGVSGYSADKFNLFDAAIVIVSIVEMFLVSEEGGGGAFSALRAFRLFRIFKIFRAGDLRTLLDSIAFTVLTIKDYTILLCLFIYVFALLGMSFFAGKVKFDEEGDLDFKNGESPRANFDQLMWSALTVFEIMIGENWNGVMYDHMRSVGELSCIYFIALVILGNIIMLNLFLAILLGNFDRARNFGEKKKIFDAFENFTKMGYKLNIAIAYAFDDQDFTRYIEDKILQDKEDKAQKTNTKGVQIGEQENNEEEHTEKEIKQVFAAMSRGNIELILTGEKELEDEVLDQEEDEMTEAQRERTLEILTYIKRQCSLRKQRQEFQEQLKRTQEQKELLDQLNADKEMFSSESEDGPEAKTIFETIIYHIQNSSLFLFPQNSLIRQWCQMCIQSDDEQEAAKKDEKAQQSEVNQIAPVESQAFSPNKVMSLDDNKQQSESPTKKQQRSAKTLVFKERNSLQLQSLSPQDIKQLATRGGKAETMKNPHTSGLARSQIKKPTKGKKNVAAKIFEGVIMTLIIISSITLVIDNPLTDPEAPLIVFVGYLDNCFTVLFTLELVIKVIAMGFLFNNPVLREKGLTAYIRNPWNMLDFIVVVASVIDLLVTINSKGVDISEIDSAERAQMASSLQSLKALRALRALRPLRMISRNQGMKLIVNALLSSLPSMTNVTIVCCLFLLIFAIMGVDSFKGTFGVCSITDSDILEKIITMQDCLDQGGSWDTPDANFDNALFGIRTLFEMMSTEGWIDVMNAGIDAVPHENKMPMQPKKNNRKLPIIYFVIFMVFGSQFILNLFVGVIMDNFNKIKEKEEWGSLFVTEDQRQWIDAQRLGLTRNLQKRIDPPSGWRGNMFRLVNHSVFDTMITFFIAFNTLVMAVKFDGIPKYLENIFEKLNWGFAFIFNCEMFFKLAGLGKQYFYSSWNLFDMIVVIATDIGILLLMTTSGSGGFSTAATVVRAFRIMRIVRLVRSQANIKIILDTLVNIIPQITNFIALMFLLLFIYAALGINMFGGVVEQEFITDKNNFKNIGTAIVLLFRCSTGEDWNKIMHELSRNEEQIECITDQDYQIFFNNNKMVKGCGSQFSYIYFLSFTIIIAWLIMNLSVAAVIEGLENAQLQNSGIVEGDDVQALIDAWQEYDPKATGWIDVLDFICLVIELPAPFGSPELNKSCKFTAKKFQKAKNLMYNKDSFFVHEEKMILVKNRDILRILSNYKIQTYEGKVHRVHFKDIYQILVKRVFLENVEDFEISKYLKTKMKNQWIDKHKKLRGMPKTGFKAHQSYASKIITSYARRFRFKRAEMKENELMQNNLKNANNENMEDDTMIGKKLIKKNAEYNKLKAGTQEFKIGFVEDSPGRQIDQETKKSGQYDAQKDERHNNSSLPQIRPRQKNKDENPQEFEEVGSQEEQSEGRAIEAINYNQQRIARDEHSEQHPDSRIASAENLQFNIKIGQSITDSVLGKSESNMLLLGSPKDKDEEGLVIPSKSGKELQEKRQMSQTMTEFNGGINHQRSRSHQNEISPSSNRGGGSSEIIKVGVKGFTEQKPPPKTPADGNARRDRAKLTENNTEEKKEPVNKKNNFFDE